MAFNQHKYIDQWQKENIERITIKVPKGKKMVLEKVAKLHNTSVNKIIIRSLEEKFAIDLSSKTEPKNES